MMDSWLFKHYSKVWIAVMVIVLSLGVGWVGFIIWAVIKGLSIAETAVQ